MLAAASFTFAAVPLLAIFASLLAGAGWFALMSAAVAVPAGLVGLILGHVAGPVDLAQVEWRLDRNRFLLVRRFWGWERVTFIQDATLNIVPSEDKQQKPWTLELRWDNGSETLMTASAWRQEDLEEVGALLSYYTHWPLIRE